MSIRVVGQKLAGNFGGYISASTAELASIALLGGRPKNISVLAAKADGGIRLMLSLPDVMGIAIIDRKPPVAAQLATFRTIGGVPTQIGAIAQAFIRIEAVGVGAVVGSAFHDGISALGIIGQDEQASPVESGNDQFTQSVGGDSSRQLGHVDSVDGPEVGGGRLHGRQLRSPSGGGLGCDVYGRSGGNGNWTLSKC